MYFDNKDGFLQPQVNQYNNHMVMTNVHKETKVKNWSIDTRFRDDYDNYSQLSNGGIIPWYTFSLPQPINDVKKITVDDVEIPISFFNISAALGNNSMKIGNNLIIVPDAFYTSTTLKIAFNKVLNTLF